MSDQVLYPKATAVWLVDNTSMTFEQIADFCGLHHLEVKGIADGEVARDIRGADPGWEPSGGVVETLPHQRFRADPPGPPPRPPRRATAGWRSPIASGSNSTPSAH